MLCKRCGKKLNEKQKSYCSKYCSKLHLKKLYRQRNKEKILKYNREYKKRCFKNVGYMSKSIKDKHMIKNPVCAKCGTDKKLEIHHIKPLINGGTHKSNNLITLCKIHHYFFEKRMNGFW